MLVEMTSCQNADCFLSFYLHYFRLLLPKEEPFVKTLFIYYPLKAIGFNGGFFDERVGEEGVSCAISQLPRPGVQVITISKKTHNKQQQQQNKTIVSHKEHDLRHIYGQYEHQKISHNGVVEG